MGFRPIANLSGHSLAQYTIHAGKSIPNIWSIGSFSFSDKEAYACEPFVTTGKGLGFVREGKTRNIFVKKNNCYFNQDVAIDFEGCENALVSKNLIVNSRGGGLVVLNGSKDIIFYKNRLETNNKGVVRNHNIILIRDGNSNISYIKNKFINKSNFDARILLKSIEKGKDIKNVNITFSKNKFKNVRIDDRETQKVTFTKNKFKN